MLGRLLKGTAWSDFTGYLSPTFFEVVPVLAFAGRAKTLVSNYGDRKGFAVANAAAQQVWTMARDQPRGDAVLELYFAQLLRDDPVVLDLRHDAFEPRGRLLEWKPAPLFVRFEPKFLAAIRHLYAGFYGDDDDTFDHGLKALGLTSAKDVMRAQFGGDQTHVTFRLATFRDTFHEIFERAKSAKAKLHPDFLPFGAYLACLYEHLEQLGGAYDARGAYLRAVS